MQPWHIKICGVTSPEDAQVVAASGADAIGVNFCPHSPRYVDPHQAASVLAAVPAGLRKVGVFVNATADQIIACCEQLPLDVIQLHGDEPPELLSSLAGRSLVRAFRCGAAGLLPVADYLQRCHDLGSVSSIRPAGRLSPVPIRRYRSHARLGPPADRNSPIGWHALGAQQAD